MSNVINRVFLTGHLGKDPELVTTANGNKMVRFSIATNEGYTNKVGEKVSETNWHNLVAWGALAERIASSMNKGMEVTIEGSLKTRSWDDKEGKRRFSTDVQLIDCQRVVREPREAVTAE